MAQPKSRPFLVHTQLSLGWDPVVVNPGETTDAIPPDDVAHLLAEGVITEPESDHVPAADPVAAPTVEPQEE